MKKKNAKKKKNTLWRRILLIVLLLILAAEVFWIRERIRSEEEPVSAAVSTSPTEAADMPTEAGTNPMIAETEAKTELQEFHAMNLGYGVMLEKVGGYTGIYMEDGSDELVSGVMMIQVKNTGDDDVQLMDIQLAYADASYDFRLTNLPAGETAILLEQKRASLPAGLPISAMADSVVLFREKMDAHTDTYEISGTDGALNVKNISGEDVEGNIRVYYKYRIQDIYYGGITFRVELKSGLAAGEIRQTMTSHYNPDNCRVVMIEVVSADGN